MQAAPPRSTNTWTSSVETAPKRDGPRVASSQQPPRQGRRWQRCGNGGQVERSTEREYPFYKTPSSGAHAIRCVATAPVRHHRVREYSVLHTLSEAGRLTHEASNNTLHARMDSGISAHEALVHGTLSSPALI